MPEGNANPPNMWKRRWLDSDTENTIAISSIDLRIQNGFVRLRQRASFPHLLSQSVRNLAEQLLFHLGRSLAICFGWRRALLKLSLRLSLKSQTPKTCAFMRT